MASSANNGAHNAIYIIAMVISLRLVGKLSTANEYYMYIPAQRLMDDRDGPYSRVNLVRPKSRI